SVPVVGPDVVGLAVEVGVPLDSDVAVNSSPVWLSVSPSDPLQASRTHTAKLNVLDMQRWSPREAANANRRSRDRGPRRRRCGDLWARRADLLWSSARNFGTPGEPVVLPLQLALLAALAAAAPLEVHTDLVDPALTETGLRART